MWLSELNKVVSLVLVIFLLWLGFIVEITVICIDRAEGNYALEP